MCILVSIGGIRLRSAERNKSHMKEKIPALMFNTMNLIFMSHLVCTLRAVRIDIYKDFNTHYTKVEIDMEKLKTTDSIQTFSGV